MHDNVTRPRLISIQTYDMYIYGEFFKEVNQLQSPILSVAWVRLKKALPSFQKDFSTMNRYLARIVYQYMLQKSFLNFKQNAINMAKLALLLSVKCRSEVGVEFFLWPVKVGYFGRSSANFSSCLMT